MTVTKSPVSLLNVENGSLEDAELWDAITDKQLTDWEENWTPELLSALEKLRQAGVPQKQWPQSRHWDWHKKTRNFQGYLSYPCVSLMCNNMTQGMMMLDTTTKRCRTPQQAGNNLVYIQYIEAAPWNRKDINPAPPRYRGVGRLLIIAAIEWSRHEGFKGRIGLHSLPQADAFYAGYVGMTDMGTDAQYQNLRYFEFSPEQANEFTQKGGRI